MTSRKPLVAGMIVGAVLIAGPVLGVLGTIFGMKRAFDVLGQSGVGDPRVVSASIGEVLVSTFAGLVLGGVGLVLFTVCLIVFLMRGNPPPPLPGVPPRTP